MARNKVFYEWTLEVMEDGEIMDSSFSNNLNFDKADLPGNDMGLVLNEGNEDNGLQLRLWAYVKNGKLPEYFANEMAEATGYKVPAKYHNELAKYLAQ